MITILPLMMVPQMWYLLLVLVLLLVVGGQIQVLKADLELCLYCGSHPKFGISFVGN